MSQISSLAPLTMVGADYRPLATGIRPQRRNPFEGLPGMGNGLGAMAGMAAAPMIYRQFGQVGMMPMGVGHDQNFYDRLLDQQYTMQQMRAVQQAAEQDRVSMQQTMRGLAAITGTPWGHQQRQWAGSMTSAMVTASPFLVEAMPDLVDQMSGQRGSAAVMSRRLIDAGRYRVDPVTGRMGMSAESTSSVSRQMFQNMFAGDNFSQMQGFSAGQVGNLADELQRRGMMSTAATGPGSMGLRGDDVRGNVMRAYDDLRRFNPSAYRETQRASGVGSMENLRPEDIDKLQLDPRVAERLRSFDATRMSQTLRSYTQAVAAIRDIFGDLGKPNAPMNELMAGLDALTLGSAHQMDPARAGTMVRNTYNLARQTGVPLENAMVLQQHAASRARDMGMEPIFGIQAAQGGLAFGGAYRAQGHAAHPAWGVFNADQMQQMDTNLRVQASGSNTANRMAVALRLADQVGGFAADSEAGRYVDSIRGGMGVQNVNQIDFFRMMTNATRARGGSAGITETDVMQMLGQRHDNRDVIQQRDIGNIVRRMQGPTEIQPFVGYQLESTLETRLAERFRRQGVAEPEANRRAATAARSISQNVTSQMFDLSTQEFGSQAVGGLLDRALAGAGVEGFANDEERATFGRQTADMFMGNANRAIQSSYLRDHGNLNNIHRLNNRTTLDETDRQRMQAQMTTDLQQSLTPLGRGTLLSRAVSGLQAQRPGDNQGALRVLAQTFGGVRMEDVNRSMLPHFQSVIDRQSRYEAIRDQLARETNPERRRELMNQSRVILGELDTQVQNLVRQGQNNGMFGSTTLGSDDVERAMTSSRGLIGAMNDIAGLRGDFGAEVSAGQLNEYRGRKINTELEARSVLMARNQRSIDQLTRYSDAEDEVAALTRQGAPADKIREATQRRDAAKPPDGLMAEFNGALGRLRQTPGGHADDPTLRRAALDMMRRNVAVATPQEVRALMGSEYRDDDERRAAIRANRRLTPWRATDEDVTKLWEANRGTMSREEARDLLNARLSAQRLGINVGLNNTNPQVEMDAISTAMDRVAAERFNVTPEQRRAFADARGRPAQPAIDVYMHENHVDETTAINAINERGVLAERQAEHRQRFDQFWRGEGGEAFRRTTEMSMAESEDAAGRLIQSPEMVQRFGSQAIEMSDTLRGSTRQLRDLARIYAGGNVSRLMANDLTVDTSTRSGVETYNRVLSQRTQALQRQQGTLREMRSMVRSPGRNLTLGSEVAARNEVKEAEIERRVGLGQDRTVVSREVNEMFRLDNTSPLVTDAIERRAGELGSESEARRFLNIDPNRQLTDHDRSEIAAVVHGAGSEQEAIAIYDPTRWSQYTGDRAALLERMRRGGMTDQQARTTLGLGAGELTRENQLRVRSLQDGLRSEQHIRSISGDDAERIEAVRMGRGSNDYARRNMGLGADNIPRELRDQILRRREQLGDRTEALRLLGGRSEAAGPASILGALSGGALPGLGAVAQQAEVERMTRAVSLARRMTPADQAALSAPAPNLTNIPAMAQHVMRMAEIGNRLGATPAELQQANGVFTRLGDMQRAAQRRDNVSGTDQARQILSEYGFSPGTGPLTGDALEFSRRLESPQGRDLGRQMLDSSRGLRRIAERGGAGQGLAGIDAMRGEYDATMSREVSEDERGRRRTTFQRKYGFSMTGDGLSDETHGGGVREWNQFQDWMQFQNSTHLDRIGPERRGRREEIGEGRFTEAVDRDIRAHTESDSRAGGFPRQMELSGTVTVIGNQMNMAGAVGGGRDFTTGTA